MTKVELYELIRRANKLEGIGIRALAKRFRIHRRTVRAALNDARPAPRKPTVRPSVKLGPYLHLIHDWLLADREAPPKQRHTARRIWQRLCSEHGCTAAESSVRREVGRLKREIALSMGQAFMPQVHLPGEEAEVDFFESYADLPGGRTKLYHFCMRACHSGREFHLAFPQLTQQAFLEAHNAAFAHFGGVFATVRYDNLTLAVKKVLQGRRRVETERFVALRSHYLFESVFCKPGKEGAHEKGGVENAQGRFRRQHLVPVPRAESLDAYNAFLRKCCQKDDLRTVDGRREAVATAWEREVPVLRPLPEYPFETDLVSTGCVDQHGRVRVAANRYSVPIRLHGLRVEVRLGAREVSFFYRGQCVARHDRIVGQGKDALKLDHYLELVRHRPGALGGSLALAQARLSGEWPTEYDQLWEALKDRHGFQGGTAQMVDVLLLHRALPREAVVAAVERALELGCLEAEAIRHLLHHQAAPAASVAPLEDLGELARYEIPAPRLDVFDALLVRAAS